MVSISKKEYDELLSLSDQLAELKRIIFGSKSERFVPLVDNQLGLFGELVSPDDKEQEKVEISYSRSKSNKEKNHPLRGEVIKHII